MTAMLAVNASRMVTAGTAAYRGGLDFLDSQAPFVKVFGDYPTMFTVTNEDKGVTMDDINVRGIIEAFVGRCEVELLLMEVEAAYVGYDNVDQVQFVTNISHDIAAFKLEYIVRYRKAKVTPDDLYQQHLERVTMLPDDSRD